MPGSFCLMPLCDYLTSFLQEHAGQIRNGSRGGLLTSTTPSECRPDAQAHTQFVVEVTGSPSSRRFQTPTKLVVYRSTAVMTPPDLAQGVSGADLQLCYNVCGNILPTDSFHFGQCVLGRQYHKSSRESVDDVGTLVGRTEMVVPVPEW
jgi:hypothetical protein